MKAFNLDAKVFDKALPSFSNLENVLVEFTDCVGPYSQKLVETSEYVPDIHYAKFADIKRAAEVSRTTLPAIASSLPNAKLKSFTMMLVDWTSFQPGPAHLNIYIPMFSNLEYLLLDFEPVYRSTSANIIDHQALRRSFGFALAAATNLQVLSLHFGISDEEFDDISLREIYVRADVMSIFNHYSVTLPRLRHLTLQRVTSTLKALQDFLDRHAENQLDLTIDSLELLEDSEEAFLQLFSHIHDALSLGSLIFKHVWQIRDSDNWKVYAVDMDKPCAQELQSIIVTKKACDRIRDHVPEIKTLELEQPENDFIEFSDYE